MADDEEFLTKLGPAIPISKRVRDVYPKGESGIKIQKKGKKNRISLNTLVKRANKKKE